MTILLPTITPHHLIYNRTDLFRGGIGPHFYCLPILKRSTHQKALLEAATSGNPKFFSSDSAPHDIKSKESACGCAGIYSAHASLEFYAGVFDQMSALDKLEGFASEFELIFTDSLRIQIPLYSYVKNGRLQKITYR